MGKAILTRSRNQTTMQFLGTPEMYKLNVGDIVDLTYAGLGFSGKVCRVEALELQSNGLVAVSLIEYFDVYTWEVPPQEPVEELANLPSAYAVKAPTILLLLILILVQQVDHFYLGMNQQIFLIINTGLML
jgi:hypothetical protein